MWLEIFLLLYASRFSYSYKANPTSWLCTDSPNEQSKVSISCLPGYVIDIEEVTYESTQDNACSGITSCRLENKNSILFSCNRKQTCHIDINNIHFHINATCGKTKRLSIKYNCLPVIHEQKDYLCEPSTPQRTRAADINLSCARNYRLHIKSATVGISLKTQQDESNKARFKCDKDTQAICQYSVPNAYYGVCDSQLRPGKDDQCKIRYHERPTLKDCPYGMTSNYSMVEYVCIPGDGITQDLPRIDICSTEIPELLISNRGLLHSPNYPQALGQYLACKKQLSIPRESRLRLFMLEKSIEYSHEFNIRFQNNLRTLVRNELLDINITQINRDQIIQFELKTNHVGDGHLLLYFQVDSYLSENAPFIFESDRYLSGDDQHGKTMTKRMWGILIGCLIGLLLVVCAVVILLALYRISRRYRSRSPKYLKSEEDHLQRLNESATLANRRGKDVHNEQPYLLSSSPVILSSSTMNGHHRPNSPSSTTSSILMHQLHDNTSDRESLIKPIDQSFSNELRPEIDNFYEEIKEQQQQTALALARSDSKGDTVNPYLEAKYFEPKTNLFQGSNTAQPIRDHHESGPRYQQPSSSNDASPTDTANEEKRQATTENEPLS